MQRPVGAMYRYRLLSRRMSGLDKSFPEGLKYMLTVKDMKQKDRAELTAELENTKKEYFRLRCRQVTDVVQNHTEIRKLRKNIARLNTIIKQKQTDEKKEKGG